MLEIEAAAYEVFQLAWASGEYDGQRLGQAFYNHFKLHALADQPSLAGLYEADPGLSQSLRRHLSEHVGVALSTMISLDPAAAFFQAPNPGPVHCLTTGNPKRWITAFKKRKPPTANGQSFCPGGRRLAKQLKSGAFQSSKNGNYKV